MLVKNDFLNFFLKGKIHLQLFGDLNRLKNPHLLMILLYSL